METVQETGVKEDFKMIGNQFFCKICNVGCPGQVTYDVHIAGGQHAARSKGEQWPPKRGLDDGTVANNNEFTMCTICVTFVARKYISRHYTHAMHSTARARMGKIEREQYKCYICVIPFSTSREQYAHFASADHYVRTRRVNNLLKFGRDRQAKEEANADVEPGLKRRYIHAKEISQLDKLERHIQDTHSMERALITKLGKYEDMVPVIYNETKAKMVEVERDDDPSTDKLRYCDICLRDFWVMTTFQWSDHSSSPLHVKKVNQREMGTSYPKTCEFCNRTEPTPNGWAAHLKSASHILRWENGGKRPKKEKESNPTGKLSSLHDRLARNARNNSERTGFAPSRKFQRNGPELPMRYGGDTSHSRHRESQRDTGAQYGGDTFHSRPREPQRTGSQRDAGSQYGSTTFHSRPQEPQRTGSQRDAGAQYGGDTFHSRPRDPQRTDPQRQYVNDAQEFPNVQCGADTYDSRHGEFKRTNSQHDLGEQYSADAYHLRHREFQHTGSEFPNAQYGADTSYPAHGEFRPTSEYPAREGGYEPRHMAYSDPPPAFGPPHHTRYFPSATISSEHSWFPSPGYPPPGPMGVVQPGPQPVPPPTPNFYAQNYYN